MNCSICSAPSTSDLCPGCKVKRVVVRPASRFLVSRAARRSMELASDADGRQGEGLIEYIVSGYGTGRRW